MEIKWTSRAEKSLRSIHRYYFYKASETVAENIGETITKAVDKLLKHPQLGRFESIGTKSGHEYRRLIVHDHYVAIYRIAGDFVVIVSVFDTRQDPQKLRRILT